jgi:hypothetical protein
MKRAARAIFAMVALTVVAALLVVAPATATAATTYRLVGIETGATSSTGMFAGVLVSQPGTWQATIEHGDLNKAPGGVTSISGGSFALAPFGASPTGGNITGGHLVAGAPTGLAFCTQQFLVGGTLLARNGPGSFQGTLTHYGIRSQGVCNASFATFVGSVTLP